MTQFVLRETRNRGADGAYLSAFREPIYAETLMDRPDGCTCIWTPYYGGWIMKFHNNMCPIVEHIIT